ncbi:MAG: LEA type 2 family protein [Longimicrobiaceae bacterium]
MYSLRGFAAASLLLAGGGCAGLGALGAAIQPPRFEAASGYQAELRLLSPSSERPSGGALVRVWTRVENPNPVGLTLSLLDGELYLEDTRSARVSFPLGLPLLAGQDTVIPIDIGVDFADLPGLADVAARALTGGTMGYRLAGTVGVDAGVLGRPTFGPMTFASGELRVR